MDEDLLGNDRNIGGGKGWGAGEDQDAEAEKPAQDCRDDPGQKLTPWKRDGVHA
jgi:hypothetical protein